MTPVAERADTERSPAGVLALICAAHCVSHYYILMLAPLFPIIKAEFNVSYTQLGLALLAFNLTSAVLTPPAGYLVDRIGGRMVLIGGLLAGSVALAGAALLPSFWAFVAMFALLGVGNTAYHPADYSLLSQHVPSSRMGQAYSIHTFAGMVGSAAAPPSVLLLANLYGWRNAYLVAAAVGLAVAALLIVFGRVMADAPKVPQTKLARTETGTSAMALLLSPPIVLNLAIFTFLSMMMAGLQGFSVAALYALYGTPLEISNIGLSIYLTLSAIGVLVGGYVAMRTSRHDFAAVVCLMGFIASAVLIGSLDLGTALLFGVLAFAGFVNGIVMPSRDMLVRQVTPPGAFGRVFAFVTNGFNIGGIISPLIFGYLLDHGAPRAVFLASAVFGVCAIAMILLNSPRRRVA